MTTPALLFLFDLETTGLEVDNDQITEIASKIFNPPVSVSQVSFESLVYTTRDISEKGTRIITDSACMQQSNNPTVNWVQTCISFDCQFGQISTQ